MADSALLVPEKTALLIMDVQPSIVAMIPDAEAYLERLRQTREVARENGLTIGYVRVALTEEDAARVPARNKSFSDAAASGRLLDDRPEVQVDSRIAPAADEIVVRKSRVGAFSTTDLREQLEGRGIDTLILTGIATSGVVLSTLRDAADRDFRLFVVEDLCFDRDPEVHRVLIEKVFPRQAEIVDADTVDELIRTSRD
jgi:nicotinamidase-related amidase